MSFKRKVKRNQTVPEYLKRKKSVRRSIRRLNFQRQQGEHREGVVQLQEPDETK